MRTLELIPQIYIGKDTGNMIVRTIILHLLMIGYCVSTKAQVNCTSSEVRTSIQIAAPADSVWQHLIHVEKYPEWHTYIIDIEGELEPKNRIRVTYTTLDGEVHQFKAKVLTYEPGKSLVWGGSLGILFSAQHYFLLDQTDVHTTTLTQGEYWHGWFGKGYGEKVFTDACANFNQMNVALKARLESNPTGK